MMRKLLPLVALPLCVVVTNLHANEIVRLSDPVAQDQHSETFGQVINTTQQALSLQQLLENPQDHVGQTVLVETSVAKVCQKKGCFFIAQQGATAVRVSFKDYGFFVPTNISGKRVTLAGSLVQVQRSPEIAAHYAEDANLATLKSGDVYEIVATAVRVPKT